MRLNHAVAILYTTVLFAVAAAPARPDDGAAQTQTRRSLLTFDIGGRRGLVLFDHRKHEALLNPDPAFPHKARAGVACTGCHHAVKEVTEISGFRRCSACHQPEGTPANPDDRDGYDLNSREVFHRLCIGCHRASNVRASNERFTNVSFTKCGECHDKGAQPPLVERPEQPPEAPDLSRPEGPESTLPAPTEIRTPFDPPRGFAGPHSKSLDMPAIGGSVARPDRWRIGFPEDPRFQTGKYYDPYHQNLLKGDYPIFGQHNFMVLTAVSESLINARRLPVPSDVSSQRPDSAEFFGRGGQLFFRQNFGLSFELFNGDTAFKPVDWRIRISPSFDINLLNTQENGIVNIDPRKGANRLDGYVALQEAFGEIRIGDTTKLFKFLPGQRNKSRESPFFDTASVRVGIQPFISDFRGFIFSDVNLGLRVFGNYASNRYQFNAAYFQMLEKDTNSELNTLSFRNQAVFVANLFRQDTRWKGYTTLFSFHYNNDRPSKHFDENGFLVRPAPIGDVAPHGIKVGYFGWAGEGHIGRLNVSHAVYQALGHDVRNPIAGRRTRINAQMAAAEVSLDRDWLRFKGSFFWASGDDKPFDGEARGFDAIFDLPEFAGGKFSFWNSQGIRLTQTGVALVNPDSLLPTLRSSKTEGQANFVNPGLFLYNAGLESELTPKLRAVLNLNYLRFGHTETLEELLFQPGIRKTIGLDYGVGFLYRPFLSENAVFAAGFSSLVPGTGFKDIYSSACAGEGCGAKAKTLYSLFVKLRLTY